MARFNYTMTSEKIERYLQDGRGQGHGPNYKPWLTVFDFSSHGQVTREVGIKTLRIHHTFSKNETCCLSIFQMSPAISDIREQFPLLPLTETELIAGELGIRHPADPKSRCNIVLTTDFLLDVAANNNMVEVARTVKPAGDLGNSRVIEKLEIERRYWATRGVDWGIIVAEDIPRDLAHNCQFLAGYYSLAQLQISDTDIRDVYDYLTPIMVSGREKFRFATRDCDQRLGLRPGISLGIGWHLMATRRWLINDWNRKLNPDDVIFITLPVSGALA